MHIGPVLSLQRGVLCAVPGRDMLLETHKTQIDTLLSRYADRRSAVLPLLYIAQDTYGHLTTEAIREVADILHLPYTDVFEVVGFYTLFYDQPVGKWVVQVCDDVPCCYLGAEELLAALKQQLGVREEQVTPDGMFLIQRVKCLAACHRAPVVQANLDYIYDVTAEKADALLRDLRARAERGAPLSVSGHEAEDYEFAPAGGLRQIARNLGAMPSVAAPAPVAPEPQKAASEEAESAPAAPAQAAAEEKMAAESPVAPAPDRSPAGERPVAEKQDEHGAVPARPAQQEPGADQ